MTPRRGNSEEIGRGILKEDKMEIHNRVWYHHSSSKSITASAKETHEKHTPNGRDDTSNQGKRKRKRSNVNIKCAITKQNPQKNTTSRHGRTTPSTINTDKIVHRNRSRGRGRRESESRSIHCYCPSDTFLSDAQLFGPPAAFRRERRSIPHPSLFFDKLGGIGGSTLACARSFEKYPSPVPPARGCAATAGNDVLRDCDPMGGCANAKNDEDPTGGGDGECECGCGIIGRSVVDPSSGGRVASMSGLVDESGWGDGPSGKGYSKRVGEPLVVNGVPTICDEGELKVRSERSAVTQRLEGMFMGSVGMSILPGCGLGDRRFGVSSFKSEWSMRNVS